MGGTGVAPCPPMLRRLSPPHVVTLVASLAAATAMTSACGTKREPARTADTLAVPTRIADASDVDDVVADARGAVYTVAGNPMNRLAGGVVAIDGDGQRTALAVRMDHPRHPVLHGDDVAFITRDGVYRTARDGGGGGAQQLAKLDHPTALTMVGDVLVIGLADSILALPPDGAAHALAGGAGAVADIAPAGDRLVWVDRSGGRVMRMRSDGADVAMIADQQAEPTALAIAGDTVVWVTRGDPARKVPPTVASAPIAGGPVRVLAEGDATTGPGEAVAIDGAWVYSAAGDEPSAVRRVPLAGGAAEPVVVPAQDIDGLAFDAGGLWLAAADGTYRARRN